jgi:Ca2+-binding RTX toxin-like protein
LGSRRLALAAASAALSVLAGSADAHPPRQCLGQRATISGPNTHLHARGQRKVIVGTSHRDVIVGSRHAEWIVGGGGPDVICGGGGADYLFVGNASQLDRRTKLYGGPGDDYIDGSFADDRISGGPGNDRMDGEFGADRIVGDGGNDFIRAQKGADRVGGGNGEDHVEASSGRDLVHGGPGDDNLSTGSGNDVAFGDRGDDSIHLVWGRDVGWGGPGGDDLHGGSGDDICHGGPGTDAATGCEHRRTVEHPLPTAKWKSGGHHAARHHQHQRRRHRHPLREFERLPALRHMEAFLHRLQHKRVIKTPATTRRQKRRSAALGHRVREVVAQRYEQRLRHHHRDQAVFKRSVERYRIRAISAAISNQIDRLRWTPHRGP